MQARIDKKAYLTSDPVRPGKLSRRRLLAALDFFKPENLAGKKIKYHPVPGDVAILLVDVQKRYCDPRGKRGNAVTDTVSMKIAMLAAAYRAIGLPVYVIHTGASPWLGGQPRFHRFKPDRSTDILTRKVTDSGFRSGTLAEQLKADGRKTLLVCGFNLSACVKLTALDARAAGYDVKLIRDLCGNDSWNTDPDAAVREMKTKGIRMVRGTAVIKWQAKR